MKKLILSFALFTVITATFSQIKVRPGFRTGINSATFTNTDNTSRKIGINAAMFANIHFARFYELQPEFTYSNQGFKQDNYNYIEPYSGNIISVQGDDFNVHYVGMAVTNKFFIVPNTGLHIIVGPSIEINVSDDSNDFITPVDFSLFGGIGYEFPFGLGLEARYKQGFIDVRDSYFDFVDETDSDYYDNNWLNSVFQFNVYYKFNF